MKIVLFLGAGASAPFGYPTTKSFLANLRKRLDRSSLSFLNAFLGIEGVSDVEHVIQMIGSLESLRGSGLMKRFFKKNKVSLDIAGKQRTLNDVLRLCGRLNENIKDQVFREYETNPRTLGASTEAFFTLFTMIASHQTKKQDIVVFSTNYDRVIEECCTRLPEFDLVDGFVHKPRSRTYSWDSEEFEREPEDNHLVKFFKLHGSLNWRRTHEDDVVQDRSEHRVSGSRRYKENILIYPASQERPSVEPFNTLYKYFEIHMRSADVFLPIGFSFRDDYINQVIKGALRKKGVLRAVSVGSDILRVFNKRNVALRLSPDFPNQKLLVSISNRLRLLNRIWKSI